MLEEPMNGVSTLSWNHTSYKMKLMFLYSTISTLKLVKFSLTLGQSYIYIDYFEHYCNWLGDQQNHSYNWIDPCVREKPTHVGWLCGIRIVINVFKQDNAST
jgi:hypothetical protein